MISWINGSPHRAEIVYSCQRRGCLLKNKLKQRDEVSQIAVWKKHFEEIVGMFDTKMKILYLSAHKLRYNFSLCHMIFSHNTLYKLYVKLLTFDWWSNVLFCLILLNKFKIRFFSCFIYRYISLRSYLLGLFWWLHVPFLSIIPTYSIFS